MHGKKGLNGDGRRLRWFLVPLLPRPLKTFSQKQPLPFLFIAGAIWFGLYLLLIPLSESLVAVLPIDRNSHFGGALQFFFYDTPKVLMLLTGIVFVMGMINSYFTPERTRALLAKRGEGAANVMAACLGIVTPFCSCSAVPLFIGFVQAGVPLGVVGFVGIDLGNQKSSWAFYASRTAPRGTGSRMEYLALEFAFSKLGLNKLYCEVLAFNAAVIKLHQKFGFSVEGVLREQCLLERKFIDVYMLGLLAREWAGQRKVMLEKLSSAFTRLR